MEIRDPSGPMAVVLMVLGGVLMAAILWNFSGIGLSGKEVLVETAPLAELRATVMADWIRLVRDAAGLLFACACVVVGALLRWA